MDLEIALSSEPGPYNASHAVADIDTYMANLPETPLEEIQEVANGKLTNGAITHVAPPTKKAKTTRVVQAGHLAARPSRRKTLSTLLNMPLDILFEVLGHLAPKDLINVSRTTKILRTTLLDRSATTVWKASRQRLGGPDPPRSMSEPPWATLIFTTTCTSCGVNNAQIVDFVLRRRMCKKCKQQSLIASTDIPNEYPGMDLAILDLISPNFDDDSFWRQDIDRMSKTIESFHLRILGGDRAAEVELGKYKEARIQIVADTRQDAVSLTTWMENQTRQKLQLKEASMIQQKIKMATERFHALGYLDTDMPNLTSERELIHGRRMTERVWERLRGRVEPSYFKNRELRREHADRIVRLSRRGMADKVYRSYAMSIPPSEWKYLPSAEIVCGWRPFRDLITADANVSVTEASFAARMDDLPRVLEAARLGLKRRCIACSPALFPGQDMSDASMQKAFEMLELVKNPFRCSSNNTQCDQVLYGWAEISSHHCLMDASDRDTPLDTFSIGIFDDYSARFLEEFPNWSRYHRDMSVYVAYVARVSGFQGMSATVTQLDSADLRYTCSLCSKDSTKVVAYTWRGCAEHLNKKHTDQEAKFRGLMKLNPATRRAGDDIVTTLSQTDADWVKEKERELERGPDSKWACTHCPTHLTHSITYSDVVQHVKETHGIGHPKDIFDLVSLRRVRKDYAIYYEPAPSSG
ncbi:hypothetical protein D9619_000316 [Psilocybe cf. subviscida]|uniref:F-box domain-containing protein n=1 Tax=Psilocybe cf. subviscida TaxID=2480587 RepID=A0A8H5F3K1_9AGAR|nr:hypothetical protein D9619_000316 [Psilocybe cf. subviscida]